MREVREEWLDRFKLITLYNHSTQNSISACVNTLNFETNESQQHKITLGSNSLRDQFVQRLTKTRQLRTEKRPRYVFWIFSYSGVVNEISFFPLTEALDFYLFLIKWSVRVWIQSMQILHTETAVDFWMKMVDRKQIFQNVIWGIVQYGDAGNSKIEVCECFFLFWDVGGAFIETPCIPNITGNTSAWVSVLAFEMIICLANKKKKHLWDYFIIAC